MHAHDVLPAGSWNADREVDAVLLDSDRRFRRRIRLATDGGQDFLLDLPQAVWLRHGDGLLLDNGNVIRVAAKPEPLVDIHAHVKEDMVRIAWHLGNRHLPVQLLADHIRIRADHVIEAMVKLLGGHIEHIEAPFDPEVGAYAGGHSHRHDDDGDRRSEHG